MRACPSGQKTSPNALNLTEGSTVLKIKKKNLQLTLRTQIFALMEWKSHDLDTVENALCSRTRGSTQNFKKTTMV